MLGIFWVNKREFRVSSELPLAGAIPEQAFFVKCDDETNPPEVIDAGRLVTEIGIAPVKPAEFIIFRISQWIGGGPEEEAGAGEATAEASEG